MRTHGAPGARRLFVNVGAEVGEEIRERDDARHAPLRVDADDSLRAPRRHGEERDDVLQRVCGGARQQVAADARLRRERGGGRR